MRRNMNGVITRVEGRGVVKQFGTAESLDGVKISLECRLGEANCL